MGGGVWTCNGRYWKIIKRQSHACVIVWEKDVLLFALAFTMPPQVGPRIFTAASAAAKHPSPTSQAFRDWAASYELPRTASHPLKAGMTRDVEARAL